jgi:hypothetical protein
MEPLKKIRIPLFSTQTPHLHIPKQNHPSSIPNKTKGFKIKSFSTPHKIQPQDQISTQKQPYNATTKEVLTPVFSTPF